LTVIDGFRKNIIYAKIKWFIIELRYLSMTFGGIMNKQLFEDIQRSIDFMEAHIYDHINIEEMASKSFMSRATYYKIFVSFFGTTVKDYIRKRRLSLAAYDLCYTDTTILDIAIKHQFNSYESFSRAFKKLYSMPPTAYRKDKQYVDVFPKVHLVYYDNPVLIGGYDMTQSKMMNEERLNEELKDLKEGFILDIDIDLFQAVNDDYGYNAGDIVLTQVPIRAKKVLDSYGCDTDVIRLGADEFIAIVKGKEKDEVAKLAEDIIASMNEKIDIGDQKIQVSVSIGIAEFGIDGKGLTSIDSARESMIKAKEMGRKAYNFL